MRGEAEDPAREPVAGREGAAWRVLERLGVADLRAGAVRAGVPRVVVGTLLRVVEERVTGRRAGVVDLRTGAVRAGALRVVVGTLLRVVEERLELAGKGPTMGLLEERFGEGRAPEERVIG